MSATTLSHATDAARKAEGDIVSFLRELVAIPSESGKEKEVIERIRREMEDAGFDEVKIDGLGNCLGRIGSGPRVIAMDSHVDTVGVGDPKAWKHDPYQGKVADGKVWGRGSSDQKAGIACLIQAARIIRELDLAGDCTIWMVASVMEEDCDGLSWHYILNEKVIQPEVVLITEPTSLRIYRGQRGRMEIGVTVRGVSCHGSAPERGVNAIYKMTPLIQEIEKLNERLAPDPFLGKGTVTVSYVECSTPSLCAVPDRAYIHLDRRLATGETKETAVREVKEAAKKAGVEAEVEILKYEVASHTGLVYPMDKVFPTWVLDPEHPALRAATATHRSVFGQDGVVDKWTFSTNGVGIQGLHGVPCFGFGAGDEEVAHSAGEYVPIDHLVRATAFYAAYPSLYSEAKKGGK